LSVKEVSFFAGVAISSLSTGANTAILETSVAETIITNEVSWVADVANEGGGIAIDTVGVFGAIWDDFASTVSLSSISGSANLASEWVAASNAVAWAR